jgi:hypothetical protein
MSRRVQISNEDMVTTLRRCVKFKTCIYCKIVHAYIDKIIACAVTSWTLQELTLLGLLSVMDVDGTAFSYSDKAATRPRRC